MAKRFVQPDAGAALAGAVMIAGLLAASGASAANVAPHVDLTQPHVQEYPVPAQASGEEGSVVVDVFVRTNGRPGKIKVAQSSGFPDLDNAAVESVFNWRFVPAMQGGDPVEDWAAVKVVYQLPSPAVQPVAARPPG
jgi:protein TonB